MHIPTLTTALTAALLTSLPALVTAQVGLIVYDPANSLGRSRPFIGDHQGDYELGFVADSYLFRRSSGSDCCVTLCRGTSAVGSQCRSTERLVVVAPGFDRVSIGCGVRERGCVF